MTAIWELTTATAKGARHYQEDRFVHFTDGPNTIAAVIDGHGGHIVADRIKVGLPNLWQQFSPIPSVHERIKSVFKVLATENEFANEGAAVSLVVVNGFDTTLMEVATVAILGDAPVLVKDINGEINISPEHNVRTNPKERDAAISRGGFYRNGYIMGWRGDGLQMSRAIGDASLRSILSTEPEIYDVAIGPESWILLGTDGLFDPSHLAPAHDEVAKLVEGGAIATELVHRAVQLPTGDNVTAILIRL